MADLIGPFDSADWAQTEWYNFAPTWAPSGIIGTPAASIGVGDFAVTASGLTLTVACAGDRAWIDGSGYKPDTNKTLTVTANGNASLSRRDRLVIRRDLAAQTITVVRLAGTPASGTPAAPALTQVTGGVWESPICSFLVPPNNGTTLTGFVDERVWIGPNGGGIPSTLQTVNWPSATLTGSNGITTPPVAAVLQGVPYRLRAHASIEATLVGSGAPVLQLFIDGVWRAKWRFRGVGSAGDNLFPGFVQRSLDVTDGRAVQVYARLDIPAGATATTYADDTHSWLTVEAVPL